MPIASSALFSPVPDVTVLMLLTVFLQGTALKKTTGSGASFSITGESAMVERYPRRRWSAGLVTVCETACLHRSCLD